MNRLKALYFSFIRRIERLTNTDLTYVISGSFFLSVGQVISALGTLLLAIGFAHFVNKDTYGTYKYILSIAALLNSFTLGGLSTSVLRSSAAGFPATLPRNAKRYLRYGFLTLIVGCAISIYYALAQNGVIAIGIAIAALTLPVIGATGLFDSYLQGVRHFKLSALFSIFSTFLQTIALLICIWFGASIPTLVAVYFLTLTISSASAFLYVLRRFRITDDGALTPEDRALGMHLSVQGIITSIAAQIDQILIFHLFGAPALAIYAFAIAIPEQSKGFIKNFNSLALARYMGAFPSRRSIIHKTLLLAVFITCCVFLYIFLAPFVFAILFPTYQAAVPYSQVYSLSLIFVASVLPQAALQAQNDTRGLYYTTIVGIACQTVGIIGLGLAFGVWGVVVGRVFGRFATLLSTVVWIKRKPAYGV